MNSTIQQPQLHDIYFPEHKKGHMNYVVQQSTDEGIGEMTCYDVVHGIQITYNDLKMDSCYRPLVPQKDFLQIDHCMEAVTNLSRREETLVFWEKGIYLSAVFAKESSYLLDHGFR